MPDKRRRRRLEHDRHSGLFHLDGVEHHRVLATRYHVADISVIHADNGDDVADTVPSRVNDETRAAIRDSDLVISKGLANYETLSGRGLNRYFLFLCKCALYSDIFGVPLHTGLIVRGVA